MASTKVRRDSIMAHRQRPSIHHMNTISLDNDYDDYPLAPLPPPVTLNSFVLPSDSKHGSFALAVFTPSLLSAARSGRFRIRPSMIALFTLFTLATFCALHQHLNDTPSLSFPTTPQRPNDRPRPRLAFVRPPRPNPPKITLAPDEELAAVVAFIAALPSNALPDSIDPTVAVDPDLVLEFDTRTPKAAHEVRELVEETWSRFPVVLFSKRYSPIAREVKSFLTGYNLKPPPFIFEIDERADETVLTPLIHRLTGTADFPILLLGGKSVGSIESIRELHTSAQLRTMVSATGAVIDGAKKKKKGKRAAH